jgi:hypothetical protein
MLKKVKYYDCKAFKKASMKKEEYFINKEVVYLDGITPSNHNSLFVNNLPPAVGATKLFQGRKRSKILNDHNPVSLYERYQVQNLVLRENRLSDEDLNVPDDLDFNNNNVNDIEMDKISVKEEQKAQKKIAFNNYLVDAGNGANGINHNENIRENTKIDMVTLRDYKSLTMKESILYDRRTCGTYFIDSFIECHRLVNLYYKRSLFHPRYIRLNELIFDLSMNFAIGALLFADSFIDARANSPNKVYSN